MRQKTMNQVESSFVNACLEFGADVTISQDVITIANPNNGERNSQSRYANTQTFETPARAAWAICENLGLG